jgi:hypothetical protein
LLIARVCLGEGYCATNANTSWHRPPDRPEVGKGVYDSVYGEIKKHGGTLVHREYITYEKTRAYAEYKVVIKQE